MACLKAIVSARPDIFPGGVIGYQTDQQLVPRLAAAGSGDTGFESNNTAAIVNLASVTKAVTYTALVKVVQDHLDSAECAPVDGVRPASCVFPQGYHTTLSEILKRLDARNGTDTHSRWFSFSYGDLDLNNQQRTWKNSVQLHQIFRMTSGWPTFIFMGYKFCDGAGCGDPNDVVCPTRGGSAECRYAALYHHYLEKRGGDAAPIPDECRPRPSWGPRLFPFTATPPGQPPPVPDPPPYYAGNVYHPVRMQQRFERRWVGEPGTYGDCVLTENPRTGAAVWRDGRQASASDVAKFYMGLPLHQPGQYTYAQPNLYFAAYIIEAMAGIPFNAYIKREIFAPLGMNDSFFVGDRTGPLYTPGGPLHAASHGSKNPNDHSNDEGGTAEQFARVIDIKRIPRTPARVLPDIAPGIRALTVNGPDRHWDERRDGWVNNWSEGGGFSTAGDLLKFLRFLRNGRSAANKVLLSADSLRRITSDVDPASGRTYAFRSNSSLNAIVANGLWGTNMRRRKDQCVSTVVLVQVASELFSEVSEPVALCDANIGHMMHLRQAIFSLLEQIPNACPPAAEEP